MKVSNLKDTDRTYFLTRSSLFMPFLFITQMNVGIYMVFGGPYVNRLYDLRASVLFMRQCISLILLTILVTMTKKMNLSITTWKDWKYTILCGKHSILLIIIMKAFSVSPSLSTSRSCFSQILNLEQAHSV